MIARRGETSLRIIDPTDRPLSPSLIPIMPRVRKEVATEVSAWQLLFRASWATRALI